MSREPKLITDLSLASRGVHAYMLYVLMQDCRELIVDVHVVSHVIDHDNSIVDYVIHGETMPGVEVRIDVACVAGYQIDEFLALPVDPALTLPGPAIVELATAPARRSRPVLDFL